MKKTLKRLVAMALCGTMCLSCMGAAAFADGEEEKIIRGSDDRFPDRDYIETESGKVFSLPKNNYEGNKFGWYEGEDKVIYMYDIETKEIKSVYCRYNHLDKFVIPDNFTNISSQLYGFTYGTEVDTIYIPKTVEDIQLEGLLYLKCGEYIVDEENPVFCSVDGAVYTKDMKCLVAYPTASKNKIYKMPESVETSYSMLLKDVMSYSNLEYFIFSSNYNLNYLSIRRPDEELKDNWNLKAVYYPGSIKGDNVISIYENINFYGRKSETPLVNSYTFIDIDKGGMTLRQAKTALRMSLGIEGKQLDLRSYVNNGEEKCLYDFDGNGNVDLKDAKLALSMSLGIK